MLRWSVSLAILVGLVIAGMSSVFWFTSTTAAKVEDGRLARVRLQQLEQQHALLQSPEFAPLIAALAEDMDALQIKLVEVVTQQPLPTGVLEVGYEQTILPQALSDGSGDAIRVLRLELTLSVLHAKGLLEMLDRINDAVVVWPHETRACALQRLPKQILSVQCVVDFYHWSNRGTQVSMQPWQWQWQWRLGTGAWT